MDNALSGLTENAAVQADGDFLGGFSALESDVYDFTIEHAYATKSSGGATAINFSFLGANNAKLRTTIYVSSGTAKGCKNTYEKKNKDGNMEIHYLPGFNQVNSLCYMTAGQPLAALASTVDGTKVINLYDYDKKGEVPTQVDMIMGLIGMKITAGVLKQTVDKKKKNDAGEYVPTGETRDENEVDKFFRTSDKLTFAEISKQLTEPAFMAAWLEKWRGKTKDKTSKTGIVTGAPGTPGQPAQPAAAAPLFANQA